MAVVGKMEMFSDELSSKLSQRNKDSSENLFDEKTERPALESPSKLYPSPKPQKSLNNGHTSLEMMEVSKSSQENSDGEMIDAFVIVGHGEQCATDGSGDANTQSDKHKNRFNLKNMFRVKSPSTKFERQPSRESVKKDNANCPDNNEVLKSPSKEPKKTQTQEAKKSMYNEEKKTTGKVEKKTKKAAKQVKEDKKSKDFKKSSGSKFPSKDKSLSDGISVDSVEASVNAASPTNNAEEKSKSASVRSSGTSSHHLGVGSVSQFIRSSIRRMKKKGSSKTDEKTDENTSASQDDLDDLEPIDASHAVDLNKIARDKICAAPQNRRMPSRLKRQASANEAEANTNLEQEKDKEKLTAIFEQIDTKLSCLEADLKNEEKETDPEDSKSTEISSYAMSTKDDIHSSANEAREVSIDVDADDGIAMVPTVDIKTSELKTDQVDLKTEISVDACISVDLVIPDRMASIEALNEETIVEVEPEDVEVIAPNTPSDVESTVHDTIFLEREDPSPTNSSLIDDEDFDASFDAIMKSLNCSSTLEEDVIGDASEIFKYEDTVEASDRVTHISRIPSPTKLPRRSQGGSCTSTGQNPSISSNESSVTPPVSSDQTRHVVDKKSEQSDFERCNPTACNSQICPPAVNVATLSLERPASLETGTNDANEEIRENDSGRARVSLVSPGSPKLIDILSKVAGMETDVSNALKSLTENSPIILEQLSSVSSSTIHGRMQSPTLEMLTSSKEKALPSPTKLSRIPKSRSVSMQAPNADSRIPRAESRIPSPTKASSASKPSSSQHNSTAPLIRSYTSPSQKFQQSAISSEATIDVTELQCRSSDANEAERKTRLSSIKKPTSSSSNIALRTTAVKTT